MPGTLAASGYKVQGSGHLSGNEAEFGYTWIRENCFRVYDVFSCGGSYVTRPLVGKKVCACLN